MFVGDRWRCEGGGDKKREGEGIEKQTANYVKEINVRKREMEENTEQMIEKALTLGLYVR